MFNFFTAGGYPGFQQPGNQVAVRHHGGFVDGAFVFIGKENTVVLLLNFHLADLAVLHHGHEGVVVHVLDGVFCQPGHCQGVEQHHSQQHHGIVENQWLLGAFYFIHLGSSLLFLSVGADSIRPNILGLR